MNHYPRHVGDITRDTFGLSLNEFGAYDRLLDAYYATEKPLSLDARERYRMAGATSKTDRSAVDYVVGRYFVEQADGWHQKRADEELAAYRHRVDTARENGANGGRPRNPKETKSVNSGLAKETELKANHKPVTSNHKPEGQNLTPPAAAPVGVRPEVWDAWRRTRGKKLTADAIRLQTRMLADFAAAGDDPNEVIEQSIRNTWAGLFPLKSKGPATAQSVHDKRSAVVSAIYGDVKHGNDEPTERDISGEAVRIA